MRGELLVAIGLGAVSGFFLAKLIGRVLALAVSWVVFLASAWVLVGHPIALLTSPGGWTILFIAGGLYWWTSGANLPTSPPG
jgi:hypothetical protein